MGSVPLHFNSAEKEIMNLQNRTKKRNNRWHWQYFKIATLTSSHTGWLSGSVKCMPQRLDGAKTTKYGDAPANQEPEGNWKSPVTGTAWTASQALWEDLCLCVQQNWASSVILHWNKVFWKISSWCFYKARPLFPNDTPFCLGTKNKSRVFDYL